MHIQWLRVWSEHIPLKNDTRHNNSHMIASSTSLLAFLMCSKQDVYMHFLISNSRPVPWRNQFPNLSAKQCQGWISSYLTKKGDLTTSQNATQKSHHQNQRHKQTPSTFNAGTWSRLARKAVMRSSVAFTSVSTASPEVAPRRRTWEDLVGKPKEIWRHLGMELMERWIGWNLLLWNTICGILKCLIFGKHVRGAYPVPKQYWMDHGLCRTKHAIKGVNRGS